MSRALDMLISDQAPRSRRRVSLAEWLAAPPSWRPDLEHAFVCVAGLDAPVESFGSVELLIPQLDEAADRLAAGRRALLRSAGDWPPFLLALLPDGDAVVASTVHALPPPLDLYYPLVPSPFHAGDDHERIDQRAALHEHLDAHPELVSEDPTSPVIRAHGLRWPRPAMIEALRQTADEARAVVAAIRGR